ncbi:asparagine synthase (glutamine-hydrolyzing) [Colwellia sp. BRX10-6]|uniref:asparagine synthase (glutamine-hydrolyzing) n=1 Tax=unclassified Colwellia TaxID=196834 RepID=UPI0015F54FD1|nr:MULTISPECIES: asparagine synthase (glutamine-hydrolyzing) [unclassified Colwellia]MBA6381814.1 asparagine synthase (glutamine-hydrolyzing) [Colwellia sp. BRX10-9]MBA6393505.1 asparagine synthase (glutamine-hydrolyzing) [Colwellia sp. BRX10-6]
MCGILGIKSKFLTINNDRFSSMLDTMPYRGPDDSGFWFDDDKKLALSHLRLSIIDPTPAGHQPREDKASNCVISYNGEVYNYIEVREQLIAKGHQFETHTDTEVVLKAYIEYGHECLQHFNGMFAIAIWDGNKKELFLARDRLGIKPLYYLHTDNEFIFASETKAILKGLDKKPDLNLQLIDSYMSFGYIPGENTLHKGIKRLMPGHYAVLKENTDMGNELNITQYWDLTFDNDPKDDKGFDFYLKESKKLLESAIDLRLRSDVPLGIFLSGGLDSSAVVGLLAERVKEPLKTFSIGYDFGKNFDETPYARQVADKFNTEHHEIKITPAQFKEFIPEFISLMDEPVTESAAISLFFVSKLAKEKVTVALSGEGSDEIFAGYDLYQYMNVLEKYRAVVGQKGSELFAGISNKLLSKSHKISKYLNMATLPIEQRYKGMSTYEEHHKEALYKSEFKTEIEHSSQISSRNFSSSLFNKTQGKDLLSKMLYFDTKTWLADDLLIKADRMSMAASLELRVPFLDYRLVEFAATIPSKHKIKNGEGKYPLKKMMEGILPRKIIYRKKMGFPTPLKLMFQNDLREYTAGLLLSDETRLTEYFKLSRIQQLIDEHNNDKFDHHRVLWQLVVLEEWLRKNTD